MLLKRFVMNNASRVSSSTVEIPVGSDDYNNQAADGAVSCGTRLAKVAVSTTIGFAVGGAASYAVLGHPGFGAIVGAASSFVGTSCAESADASSWRNRVDNNRNNVSQYR